ncbi:hypothetical protein Bbelb_176030 [Branchiostoma belcheri]|nr:hypothetical protein Bbelb_176030 [Branchiostoma belcheri]
MAHVKNLYKGTRGRVDGTDTQPSGGGAALTPIFDGHPPQCDQTQVPAFTGAAAGRKSSRADLTDEPAGITIRGATSSHRTTESAHFVNTLSDLSVQDGKEETAKGLDLYLMVFGFY